MSTNRRRRSGAMHAESCEEYLQKITEEVNEIPQREKKKSFSLDDAFKEFEFQGDGITLEPIPSNIEPEQDSSSLKLKVLLYSVDQQFSPDMLEQLLSRDKQKQESGTRSRTSTSESLSQENQEFLDIDFHHCFMDHTVGKVSLHFWILNSLSSNYEIFKQIYLELVDIVIIVQSASQQNNACDFFQNAPKKCLVANYVVNDAQRSLENSPIKYEEKQNLCSSGLKNDHFNIWSILQKVIVVLLIQLFQETQFFANVMKQINVINDQCSSPRFQYLSLVKLKLCIDKQYKFPHFNLKIFLSKKIILFINKKNRKSYIILKKIIKNNSNKNIQE